MKRYAKYFTAFLAVAFVVLQNVAFAAPIVDLSDEKNSASVKSLTDTMTGNVAPLIALLVVGIGIRWIFKWIKKAGH